jgi:hypothetical protein
MKYKREKENEFVEKMKRKESVKEILEYPEKACLPQTVFEVLRTQKNSKMNPLANYFCWLQSCLL